LGLSFFRQAPLFLGGEPASVFPFNPLPSREKRSKGRLKPSGIKISFIFARRWGDACAGKPSGRLRHIFKRAPSRGLWHPGPLSGLGGVASGAEREREGGGGSGGRRGEVRGFGLWSFSHPFASFPFTPFSSVPVTFPRLDRMAVRAFHPKTRARDAGVLKEPRPTRLETRTKESNARASVVVSTNHGA